MQKTTASAQRSAWSYQAGERGRNRVRVYARPPHGIWIDYHTENGKRVRRPLGHDDRVRAKRDADEVAARFGELALPIPARLTLRKLFDSYEGEVTPQKRSSTQAHDRRARAMFEQCWGRDTEVAKLDRRDWDRFIQQRRAGALSSTKARNGVIEKDLRFVLAVIHWAETVRDNGRMMVEQNPFRGFPVPTEASPRRPSLSEEEFTKACGAARRVDAQCPLFLLLAHETGHRGAAIGQLRWSDIDLTSATIRWREEYDKTGTERTTPMSSVCADALRAMRRERAVIGDAWLFPSPRDLKRPVSRERIRDWWRRLELLSGMKRIPGRGWHSCRRKFATEHMDLPIAELMSLGGWKNSRTIVHCYQQPREQRLREALERRIEERKSATGTQ